MKIDYRTVLLIGFILVGSAVNGQTLITHKKRMYQSPEGRLYINKDLPVYLRISTSPGEDAESFLLKSEETPEYSNPMYFDTEGVNTFQSPSAVDTSTKKIVYPERDIVFEVYTDSRSPKTHIDYGKVLTVQKADTVYLGGLTTFTLEPKDEMSGIQAVYYSIDNKPYQEYSSPLEFNKEGTYVFKTYAVDNVGNHEEVIYRKIIIDDSNPSTQLEIEGDRHENILSANSAIKLIASDEYGIDAIYYSVDGSPEKKYTYKLKGSYFSQGTHVLTYYSIDKLGNKEGVKEFKFYVDKTPPTIVEEIIGKTFIANGREYSSGRSKLKLTTFDNKAGVKEVYYSINGSEYHLYDKPFYLSNTSGNLVLKTYAVDNVNNKSVVEEESTVSSIPYIDLSGPSLSHRFSGPTFVLEDTVYISRETKISLHAKDDESGLDRIEYRIDEGDLTDYTEPFSISGEGVHKIYFNGYDNVSNSNFGELMVKVDTTGPEIYTRFSIPPKGNAVMDSVNVVSYPPHLVLFLSSTDEQVGVERMYYSINNGREVPYNGLISNFKAEQRYQLKIKALDKLGNVNESLLDFGIKN